MTGARQDPSSPGRLRYNSPARDAQMPPPPAHCAFQSVCTLLGGRSQLEDADCHGRSVEKCRRV